MFKFFCMFLLLMSGAAFADQINVNRSWSSFSLNSQMIEDGIDLDDKLSKDWRGVFIAQFDHVDHPLIIIDESRDKTRSEIVDDFKRIRLSAGHFLSKNWFLGISTSIDQVVAKPYDPKTGNLNIVNLPHQKKETLLGDSTLMLKYRFVRDSNSWNWTLIPYLVAPTGKEEFYNTDASFSGGIQLAFTKYINDSRSLRLHGNVGYGFFPKSVFKVDIGYQNEINTKQRLTYGAGLTWMFTNWGSIYAEFAGLSGLPFKEDQNPVEATIGGRLALGERLVLFGGYGLEGLQAARSHENRFLAGLKFAFNEVERKPIRKIRRKPKLKPKPKPVPKPVVNIEQKLSIARNIKFQTNKAVIKPESFDELNEAAATIVKYIDQIKSIEIQGHTDSRGSAVYNKSLSQRRSDAVVNYLVSNGVPRSKLNAIGYGEGFPVETNKTAAGRELNRRVEFKVSNLRTGVKNAK